VLETEFYLTLAPFSRPYIVPFLTDEAQEDLDYLLAQEEEASSIIDIELKYNQVEDLNHSIKDHRPIPTYKEYDKIKVLDPQWYLSKNIYKGG
jgi:hypothetical protein